jgi:hypothetical protein
MRKADGLRWVVEWQIREADRAMAGSVGLSLLLHVASSRGWCDSSSKAKKEKWPIFDRRSIKLFRRTSDADSSASEEDGNALG